MDHEIRCEAGRRAKTTKLDFLGTERDAHHLGNEEYSGKENKTAREGAVATQDGGDVDLEE